MTGHGGASPAAVTRYGSHGGSPSTVSGNRKPLEGEALSEPPE
jgi:hypothetical protein